MFHVNDRFKYGSIVTQAFKYWSVSPSWTKSPAITLLSPRVVITDVMDHEAHIREAETDNLDFDDSANALWSLYGQEAKNLDDATIKDIKSDMDGLLIFVRSYSSTSPSIIGLSC